MREKKAAGIYTTHGEEKLLCVAARVDGEKALAFQKNDRATGYISLKELEKQLEDGPYIEIFNIN